MKSGDAKMFYIKENLLKRGCWQFLVTVGASEASAKQLMPRLGGATYFVMQLVYTSVLCYNSFVC